MAIVIGTLLVFGVCILLLAIGPLMTGKPLPGGCGKKGPAAPRCAECPKRKLKHSHAGGESP
jgi:hypothetical protein